MDDLTEGDEGPLMLVAVHSRLSESHVHEREREIS